MAARVVCQTFLWIFSIFVFFGGAILAAIALAAYFAPDFSTVYQMLAPIYMNYAIWGAAAIGVIVLFVALLGCYSLCHNNRCTITIYWILLLIAAAPVLIASAMLFIKSDDLRWTIEDTLNDFKVELNASYTTSFLNFQSKYECCGIDNKNDKIEDEKKNSDCYDWKNSFPAGCDCNPDGNGNSNNNNNNDGSVILGICDKKSNNPQNQYGCKTDLPNEWKGLYTKGCRQDLLAVYDKTVMMISIAGIVVGVIFLLAAFCSTCVCVCCGKKERCCGDRFVDDGDDRSLASITRSRVTALTSRASNH